MAGSDSLRQALRSIKRSGWALLVVGVVLTFVVPVFGVLFVVGALVASGYLQGRAGQ